MPVRLDTRAATIATAAGVTPGTRDAWPIVAGRTFTEEEAWQVLLYIRSFNNSR